MKKIIVTLLLIINYVWSVDHTVIMFDGITVVIPMEEKVVCKKRPQIKYGSYVERFYNLPDLDVSDSWYGMNVIEKKLL